MRSFCATGVSSGLATKVTLIRVSRGGSESLLHGDGPASDFICVPYYVTFVGLRFKWDILYIHKIVIINDKLLYFSAVYFKKYPGEERTVSLVTKT
jgi:hypothetical protein